MIVVEGRRVWVADRRCHHGAVGVGLAAAGLLLPGPAGPVLLAIGVALVVHDWPDRPWLAERRPAPARERESRPGRDTTYLDRRNGTPPPGSRLGSTA